MAVKLLLNNLNKNDIYGKYVSDSIVFWLDGIENNRNGHSESISTWEDLSSNKIDIEGLFEVSNNYINVTSDITKTLDSAIDLSDCTIEIRGKITTKWAYLLELQDTNDKNFIGFPKYSNSTEIYLYNTLLKILGANSLCLNMNNYAFTLKNNNYNIYLNGINCANGTSSSTSIKSELANLLIKLNSSICSIRIHNRALTDSEILENYNQDLSRFI